MEKPKKLYSERKAAAAGVQFDLIEDTVPWQVINAIAHNIHTKQSNYTVRSAYIAALNGRCATAFGAWDFTNRDGTINFLSGLTTDYFLDFCEILVEESQRIRYYTLGSSTRSSIGWGAAEININEMFERHRFAYRLEEGFIRRVGSPALDNVIVKPVLFALQKPGWNKAEASYIEALHHRRGGKDELDDALTAAASAVEASLKAAGYAGSSLAPLIKSYLKDPRNKGTLSGVPSMLTKLLERVMAERHSKGDAHGKSPQQAEVDPALADLLIHWAGSFIVYLHDRQG